MFARRLGAGAELRPLEPWQAAELAACVDRARDDLARWTVLASRVVDVTSARQLLQQYADMQARDKGRYLGIWLDGVLVGGVLFRTFDTATGICEVGAWLAPEAQGQGLATEALRCMIDWAVGVRGMQRVELHASPANERGWSLAPRLGMTREAVLRSAFTLNGTRHDSEVWAILASEWRSNHYREP
jgi:RimJ/RimL family protein N-acetyltransferase